MLIGDLHHDNEARLDRAKGHSNRAAVRGVGDGFDVFATGDAWRDPIRIPDEGPDPVDWRRNDETFLDLHL